MGTTKDVDGSAASPCYPAYGIALVEDEIRHAFSDECKAFDEAGVQAVADPHPLIRDYPDGVFRVKRLYRRVVGWKWWLQFGVWAASEGIVGTYTGRPKRQFVLVWEQMFDSETEARERFADFAG